MQLLIGLVIGFSLGASYPLWADCCGAFNVPFDTQLEMERQQTYREMEREPFVLPSDPCERSRR